jgi:hypothetical protein
MGKALVLKTKDKPAMHLTLDEYESVHGPSYARLATFTTPQELDQQPNPALSQEHRQDRENFPLPKDT